MVDDISGFSSGPVYTSGVIEFNPENPIAIPAITPTATPIPRKRYLEIINKFHLLLIEYKSSVSKLTFQIRIQLMCNTNIEVIPILSNTS